MRRLTLPATVLVLGALAGCDEQKAPTTAGPKPGKVSQSVEYRLAIRDARRLLPDNDPSIAPFTPVLSSLDTKYPEDAQQIGELTVQAHQKLEAAGSRETVLSLLQNVDKAGGTHKDSASALNAYVGKRVPSR